MKCFPRLFYLAAVLGTAACTDSLAPGRSFPVASSTRDLTPLTAPEVFQRYVALGTSNSMGVQSAGIFAGGQRAAWPAQLAAHVGVPFSLPLEQDPGCGPPLLPPLAGDAILVGAFGTDLVTLVMNTCAPTVTAGNTSVCAMKVRSRRSSSNSRRCTTESKGSRAGASAAACRAGCGLRAAPSRAPAATTVIPGAATAAE